MSEIIALQIPEAISKEEYEWFLSKCTKEKQEKLARFRYPQDAYRSLFGEMLIRAMISKHLSLHQDQIKFELNAYGKPHLAGVDSFHFNVSHAGKWVVAVWARVPIGIDVEEVKSIDIRLAQRFFSKIEIDDLLAKSELDQYEYFYDLWTLKESYIKAVGKGLSIPLDSFSMRVLANGAISVISEEEGFHCKQYPLEQGYKLSVCAIKDDFAEHVSVIQMNDLVEYLDN
ncbi:4'-phosphopantetheinyl transferase superfamily protein [Paenibacillus sp. SYP-B3998]|uniref:4'-phosphopantetheinyl transferase superfamily protein n=1 Tax=Paenibacillus sp. SYP-B3998 TaxID=2678564 RepID=A0A6G3ZX70_9BACL|nr:4'-phosphopantetheinyl transferase superfamily protein [Paenibacillus sp. SYP-B3998]NEW06732.1 4'-phosphopantetheinyl transferase superfamily protein [Paenibacillus sp. SYP-B3998]